MCGGHYLDVTPALRRHAISVFNDSSQQEIARPAWELEVAVDGALAERTNLELLCLIGYSFALWVFERESKRALDLMVLVIHQHDLQR